MWILLFILVTIAWVTRWSRWLGVAQQKEYRADRLLAWLKVAEGRRELLRIFPKVGDFSRTGFKRPALTLRLLVVAFLSLVLELGWLVIWFVLGQGLVGFVVSWLVLPGLILLSIWPTTLVVQLLIYVQLQQAANKIKSHAPLIIGIGGCYGKTSTKLLLHHLLDNNRPTFTTPLSYNTKLSVAQSINQGYTGQEWAIIEYGSYHRGEIATLAKWFPPQIGMTTGFTEQHLELFGSFQGIIDAEAELAASLPSNQPVFCNAVDEGAIKIAQTGADQSSAKLVPYSGADSVIKLQKISLNKFGQVKFTWHDLTCQTQLVGRHYVENIQGALAVATYLGIKPPELVKALETFEPNDRFTRVWQTNTGSYVIDDGYASNPEGFVATIELATELKKQHKLQEIYLIFAGIVDLGEESAAIHTRLAKVAKAICDKVVYVGDVGQEQFKEIFGQNLISVSEFMEVTSQLNHTTAVVIEGRVPTAIVQLHQLQPSKSQK